MEATITGAAESELDRRTAALGQAQRIREHLPVLEARAAELETELEEVRVLIADEEAAAVELEYEGTHPPEAVARRRTARSRAN